MLGIESYLNCLVALTVTKTRYIYGYPLAHTLNQLVLLLLPYLLSNRPCSCQYNEATRILVSNPVGLLDSKGVGVAHVGEY
jgi:hypothetical protein